MRQNGGSRSGRERRIRRRGDSTQRVRMISARHTGLLVPVRFKIEAGQKGTSRMPKRWSISSAPMCPNLRAATAPTYRFTPHSARYVRLRVNGWASRCVELCVRAGRNAGSLGRKTWPKAPNGNRIGFDRGGRLGEEQLVDGPVCSRPRAARRRHSAAGNQRSRKSSEGGRADQAGRSSA